MLIDKEEFKQFQQEQSLTTSRIVSMNYKMIQDLTDEGYALKDVYEYLAMKKIVSSTYSVFCRACKNVRKKQKNRQISVAKQPQVKKPVVSTTKTQFFEHNASPTEEDIAKLIGE